MKTWGNYGRNLTLVGLLAGRNRIRNPMETIETIVGGVVLVVIGYLTLVVLFV
jgi:putative Mn2+ efflux pump MntP